MLVALAIWKRYRCFLPPTVSVATKLDLVGEAVGLAVGPSVGPSVGLLVVGPSVGLAVGPSVGLAVGPSVGLAVGANVGLAVGPSVGLVVGPSVGSRVGAHVESSEPWYMVSLCLPIATGFVLLHAGRTSTHMAVLRNTTSRDSAVGREGMQHHSAKTNVECEAP